MTARRHFQSADRAERSADGGDAKRRPLPIPTRADGGPTGPASAAAGAEAITSRRTFMKLSGACAATLAAGMAPAARAGGNAASRVSDDWMGMLTDLTLCVGCRKCEWACKEANDLPNQQPLEAYDDKSVFEHRRRTDADAFTVVNRYGPAQPGGDPTYVKTQCMHCFEPACASACLVAAFRKTPEGPVLYDDSVCIGCRYCMVACPFGVPAYTYDNPISPVVRKCTMCFQRITSGGGRPACAEMCPVEAITFGKRSDLLALARSRITAEPDRYVSHIYGENEAGGTGWLFISGRPFEELNFRTDLGSTPYPELTKGFLSAVPLVLVMWPALLMGAYSFSKHRKRTEIAHVETTPDAPTGSEGGHQP